MLPRLYIFKYKFNNTKDVKCCILKIHPWHHLELVGLGQVTSLLVIGGSGRVRNLAGWVGLDQKINIFGALFRPSPTP